MLKKTIQYFMAIMQTFEKRSPRWKGLSWPPTALVRARDLKLAYLKDSNAAAHSVDSDIF